jgi:hypothetical protein
MLLYAPYRPQHYTAYVSPCLYTATSFSDCLGGIGIHTIASSSEDANQKRAAYAAQQQCLEVCMLRHVQHDVSAFSP